MEVGYLIKEPIDLLPGFRFHPTDDELITCYLLPKTLDIEFVALAIGEADLRKLEPWELPWIAKMGEEEWYFFCLREKRYPTGQRTNRGTKAGYWKATGKDKAIYSGKSLVGMKKTLVFYQGRAPNGVKSNWVMHEFRLDGKYSKDNLPQSAQSECVISRVFHKNPSGKKTHISDLPNPQPESVDSLPPLIPCSPCNSGFDAESFLPLSSGGRNLENRPPDYAPKNAPPSPFDFLDQLQFSDSIPMFLFDDSGDGNDLLGSLKAEPWTDSGPGGGSGGGYGAGGL